MKTVFSLCSMLLVIFCASPCIAADLYVDPTCAAGSDYDDVGRTQGEGGGKTSYQTVNAALAAQSSGDDIYIRGGTYQENASGDDAFHMDYENSGTSEDWSSIQSYPGEWAILDADDSSTVCLGDSTNQVSCPSDNGACVQYIKIERLEIKNASNWGICLAGGPVTIRYCYIHDNIAATGANNPAGIYSMRPTDWIIEYNYLNDNGADASDTNNANIQSYSDQAASSDPQSCTDAYFLSTGLCGSSARLRNTIRYNYIKDDNDKASWGIKHKALQIIMPYAVDGTINESWEEYGDKIHHNIVVGSQGIQIEQDVAQVYNNIVPEGLMAVGYRSDSMVLYAVVYNNYSRGMQFGIPGTPISTYYFWAPSTSTMFLKNWTYNNILDQNEVVTYDLFEEITMGYSQSGWDEETALDLDDFYFQNNYIYRPSDGAGGGHAATDDIWNTYLTGEIYGSISLDTWESTYSAIQNNYRKDSSEGSDNLMTGESGANQYIPRSAHVVEGEVTIANGGIGGNHPYLSGVTIPSYVGPVNPSDTSWVAGVLALDVTYFTSATAGSDPTWIEGSGSTPAVSGNGVSGSGVSNSGGG